MGDAVQGVGQTVEQLFPLLEDAGFYRVVELAKGFVELLSIILSSWRSAATSAADGKEDYYRIISEAVRRSFDVYRKALSLEEEPGKPIEKPQLGMDAAGKGLKNVK